MRVVAKVLRAAFRLLLGVLVTYGGAEGFLHVLEFLLTKPGPGGAEAARTTIYGGWHFLAFALVIGVSLAILCDRVWVQLRALGPELRLPSSRT
jgi:hypothetical protein